MVRFFISVHEFYIRFPFIFFLAYGHGFVVYQRRREVASCKDFCGFVVIRAFKARRKRCRIYHANVYLVAYVAVHGFYRHSGFAFARRGYFAAIVQRNHFFVARSKFYFVVVIFGRNGNLEFARFAD